MKRRRSHRKDRMAPGTRRELILRAVATPYESATKLSREYGVNVRWIHQIRSEYHPAAIDPDGNPTSVDAALAASG